MTEAEFKEQQTRDLKMLYNKGFENACDTFDKALSLLGPITISVEYAKKLVSIIRKMQHEKNK